MKNLDQLSNRKAIIETEVFNSILGGGYCCSDGTVFSAFEFFDGIRDISEASDFEIEECFRACMQHIDFIEKQMYSEPDYEAMIDGHV